MKLEVGMYVRTKRRTLQPPQIARIKNISKDSSYKNQYYIELDKNLIPSYEYHIYKEDIENAKHSPIELVKVGDYVNGHKVERVDEPCQLNPYGSVKFRIDENYDYEEILGNEIKSIVTKEQFESMAYKVVE